MKRRLKKKYRRIIIFAPIAIFLLTLIVLILTKEKPPIEDIKIAREKLSAAKSVNAQRYSKNLFNSASAAYDSAMYHWGIENKKFYFFRDYERVKFFAQKSSKYATFAIEESDSNSKNIKKDVEEKIQRIQSKISMFDSNLSNIPEIEETRKQYNKGKIIFGEAKFAFEKDDYIKAQQKIDVASKMIEKSYNQANSVLVNYFGNYQKWQRWVNNTIEQSRLNETYAIVVDKFSRECILYYKGTVKAKFDIDLGKNWIGDKNHQGDYTTPEGNYKVIDKKANGRTQYYKALLINYPNDEDKARFALNKKNGTISSRKRIGDLIEIHGDGGKGADWTQGCVALANDDMDRLFAQCPIGTPVTIVGSLRPLSEIMKIQ